VFVGVRGCEDMGSSKGLFRNLEIKFLTPSGDAWPGRFPLTFLWLKRFRTFPFDGLLAQTFPSFVLRVSILALARPVSLGEYQEFMSLFFRTAEVFILSCSLIDTFLFSCLRTRVPINLFLSVHGKQWFSFRSSFGFARAVLSRLLLSVSGLLGFSFPFMEGLPPRFGSELKPVPVTTEWGIPRFLFPDSSEWRTISLEPPYSSPL